MEHEENPPSPTANKVSVQLNELRFFSNFDSGNLAGVAECPSLLGSLPSYSLSIGADCEGTPHVNQYMMWYYFGIEGGSPGQSIVLRIEKLNAASKVYNKDLRPLFRTKLRTTWTRWVPPTSNLPLHALIIPFRLQEPCTYAVIEGSIRLTFRFTFDASGIAYFAYYYPFPHAEHLQLLERFDKVYGHGPNWASRGKWRASHRPKQRIVKDLYFRKELLSHTLDGHPVHLLTISSTKGEAHLELPMRLAPQCTCLQVYNPNWSLQLTGCFQVERRAVTCSMASRCVPPCVLLIVLCSSLWRSGRVYQRTSTSRRNKQLLSLLWPAFLPTSSNAPSGGGTAEQVREFGNCNVEMTLFMLIALREPQICFQIDPNPKP